MQRPQTDAQPSPRATRRNARATRQSDKAIAAERSARIERAILDAAIAILREQPLANLRMEDVAARAGVAKTTLYRRWHSREALATAVLMELAAPLLTLTAIGDTSEELVALLTAEVKLLTETALGPVMTSMFSEIAANPSARAQLITVRDGAFRAVIARGVARGDLPRDTDPDIALEALSGRTFYRMLFGGVLDSAFAQDVVDGFLRGYRSTLADDASVSA